MVKILATPRQMLSFSLYVFDGMRVVINSATWCLVSHKNDKGVVIPVAAWYPKVRQNEFKRSMLEKPVKPNG